MPHLTRPLRRRPRVERQVLAILRQERDARVVPGAPPCFARLRELAAAEGYAILPPDTPYLGEAELTLLSWIAAAQRTVTAGCEPAAHPLGTVISHCAKILGEMGLRLYPLSLYSPRLRNMG